jgi:hypothetical protein
LQGNTRGSDVRPVLLSGSQTFFLKRNIK